MEVILEDLAASSPLSPEQRALLSYWGGEEYLHHAINILRLDVDTRLAPERLRSEVMAALQNHLVLNTVIGRESGFRGLRMQSLEQAIPLSWQVIDEKSMDELGRMALAVERGEQVHATLVQKGDGHSTLILAVSALAADRGSLIALAGQIGRGDLDRSGRKEFFQYSQYMQWRGELEADVDAVAGRDYWAEYLRSAELLTAPRLVYRREGSGSPTGQRMCVRRDLDATAMARVIDAAAAAGVQTEVLLQTVWWVLLARLTKCNRYVAGWQHDCRRDYDVMQGAVGVFDKILPLVIEGSADEPFSTWLERMAACLIAHTEVQEYCPIDTLVTAAHLLIGFVYHDALVPDNAVPLRVVELPGPMPCFELALLIDVSSDDSAVLTLHADTSLYPQRALECLLEQYVTLLQGVLEQPDSPVSTLPWMDTAAWQTLRAGWQGPEIDFGQRSIAQHIAHWAQTTPDAPAVVAGEQWLSYAALNARGNRLAHWMRAQGIEAGALVALELPRSIDLVVAILATWRIGAGYLPLEPMWPSARTAAVLTDADPALVLRATPSFATGATLTAAMSDIDLDDFPPEPPEYKSRPDDLAYVLYTSGSTGQPKGVMIEQQQLLNYTAAASFEMKLADSQRWGLLSTVAADLGNTVLFGALFNGACLVIADEAEARDTVAFARFIAEFDIDAIKIVPSHLEALLERDTPRLPHTLVLGGEAASRSLLERIVLLAPDSVVYNHYGPTETTVGVMVHRAGGMEAEPDTLPLSRVLANNHVYVLDDNQQPVPVGARGELYVGGAQVCRNYLNRDIGGAFIVDPWQPEQRLYRTGDEAWVLPDGGIRLAGRSDHQVKVRGFRVDPTEVEAVILANPDVRQAVVIARSSGVDVELIAFIAGVVTDSVDVVVWRKHAARHLPVHMRPAHYVVLDEFPRLSNGKVDRLTLAAMQHIPQAGNQGAGPDSPLEAILADAMADLLKRETVATDADFFELGGHSLLVIRLVARIRTLFQIDIEPGLVFDHPSAQALAAALCTIDHSARLNQLAQAAQGQV